MTSFRSKAAIILLLAFAVSTPAFSQQKDDPAASILTDLEVVFDESADVESRLSAIEGILDKAEQTDSPLLIDVPRDELIAALYSQAGILYAVRQSGDRAENLEKAIAAYEAVLSIFTKDVFPQDWATPQDWAGTVVSLADAYRQRIRGSRADNLEIVF